MAKAEHLAILKQGAEAWNRFRTNSNDTRESTIVLRGVDLRGTNLAGADLSEVDFSLLAGESDLGAPYDLVTDLSEVDLSGANLTRASLFKANLKGAKLTGTILERAQMFRADLSDADLSEASLIGADFREAKLDGASLRGAYIGRADFRQASLCDTDFAGANAGVTSFVDVDLSVARGLAQVMHYGASTVGIDTLYKSRGKIPEAFLRGCGVPDEFIAYIGSLVGRPIEYYSCFISYSSKDQDFADRLYVDLQAKGVRCWFAPHDIRGGRKIHEQIDEAIRVHDKLLLILSEDSIASDWVQEELARARRREVKEGKRMLFPVRVVPFDLPHEAQKRRSAGGPDKPRTIKEWECFDADSKKDWAREIREYFIPDFSNWKDHDSYQKAFMRLVSDLKAEPR